MRGVMRHRCLCVEGWAFQKRVSVFRFGLFYVLKNDVCAQLLRFVGYTRSIEYGRETSVASLFGCCAVWATRLREAETTESLVPTESDEPTPRQERYGGGGTNGVYDDNFVYTALADSVTCIVEFWLCCEDVLYSYGTAKKI